MPPQFGNAALAAKVRIRGKLSLGCFRCTAATSESALFDAALAASKSVMY
jgi:hypothetical protein